MNRKVYFVLILFSIYSICAAQQVVSSGGYTVKSDISVNWILGGSLSDIHPVDNTFLSNLYQEQLREDDIALNVYPVPATDFIYIKLTPLDSGLITIELYNNTGINVLSKITNYQPLVELYISDIPSGVYYLKMFQPSSKDQIFIIQKVIKQ